MKHIELFENGFDETIIEKIKPENWPYIAYSPSEGFAFTKTPINYNYFYIESLEDNNVITLDSTTWAGYGDNKSKLEYSNDTTSWTSMNGVDSITINNGERLYMRCIEGNICKNMVLDGSMTTEDLLLTILTPLFKTSTNCNIGGNINTAMFDYTYKTEECVLPTGAFAGLFAGIDIMTGESANYIIDASKLKLPAAALVEGCYSYMFVYCTSLVTAPELPATTLTDGCYSYMFVYCISLATTPELPATTLANDCYSGMFNGCTSLSTAPELPATTLTNNCYDSMFSGCTSLTVAPELPATTVAKSCYNRMFQDCTSLTTAPLVLPATTLADDCYYEMFYACTSLTSSPELPATTIADRCYKNMFNSCESLTSAPKILPATELAVDCYYEMFRNCTSLVTAPELPATTLTNMCYNNMFYGCTSLVTAPAVLPATTLTEYCYNSMFYGCTALTTAPALPATRLAYSCYGSMFYYCTSLTTAPALPATDLADHCYRCMFCGCTSLTTTSEILPATTLTYACYEDMFNGCTSLTAAPELPATTLTERCYHQMFYGCTSLNYIKCLAIDISVAECAGHWVYGVASAGTFVKHPDMHDWTSSGFDGIPRGWTVEDDENLMNLNGEYNLIDLGLSVKWADRNVGAETPRDSGLYFSWGNVDGHEVDENGNVIDGYLFDYTRYSTTPGGQYTDNRLDAKHDAAITNIGGGCRMPTPAEADELVQNTDHYYIDEDGSIVNESNLDGSTLRSICFVKKGDAFDYDNRSNFIEFPFAGNCDWNSKLSYKGLVCYTWTNYRYTSNSSETALSSSFDSSGVLTGGYLNKSRYCGQPVRGVRA